LLKNLGNTILVVALFLVLAGCAQQPVPVQQSASANILANTPPTADFTANPNEGQAPLTVTFTALTTGEIDLWHWDFGDGQFSKEPAPTHTYTSEDEYNVTLTVAGPGGSDTKAKVAYINIGQAIIDWKETANYIGQNKTVEGVIVGTHYASNTKGTPTFLNFNMPYKGFFTCLIWGSDRAKFIERFPPNPETYLLNKRVLVKGLIEEYPKGSGDPEIILREPSQIEVIEK
jgi:hypothetical protein